LLTLVVVPVMYTYMDDLAMWARRKWQRAGTERGQGLPAKAVPQSKNQDAV